MKIPKQILKTIKDIEDLGSKLQEKESELYKWLDENNINYDADSEEGFDLELEFLMQRQNGNDLIKRLEEL